MTEHNRNQFKTSDVEILCVLIRNLTMILMICLLSVLLSIIWPGIAPLMALLVAVLLMFVFLNRAYPGLDPQDIEALKKAYEEKPLEELRIISRSGPQGDYRTKAIEAARSVLKDREGCEILQT